METQEAAASNKAPTGSITTAPLEPTKQAIIGLTLQMDDELGGATITEIDPSCSFKSQIEVGDRIVAIDGKKVTSMDDFNVNSDKLRKLGIAKMKPQSALESEKQQNVPEKQEAKKRATPEETNQEPKKRQPKKKKVIPDTQPNENSTPSTPNTKPPKERKQTFPILTQLAATSLNETSNTIRKDLLTELLQFNKRNSLETTTRLGPFEYQILSVPLKRRESVNTRELDHKSFWAYNKQTKLMDKFLGAWAKWCNGSTEDAANMLLVYMAKKFPGVYVGNFEVANKKVGGGGSDEVRLPVDFVSYDGTNDVTWNSRYAELIKYHQENGDSKVHTKSSLGRWVCTQRGHYHQKSKCMTEQRITLLEQLNFQWRGDPDRKQMEPGGNPRHARAVAAKMVYPHLSIWEALLLGGFTEDELNCIPNQKHTWRTGYVTHKKTIVDKLRDWDKSLRRGARLQAEKLVDILQGEDEDKADQVFGENSYLLPQFLVNAEEREREGVLPDHYVGRAKRAFDEVEGGQVEGEYVAKVPCIESADNEYIDTAGDMAGDEYST